MKNILITSALVALLGLALSSAPVTAQTTTGSTQAATKPVSDKIKGSITAIDTTANTVTVENKSKSTGAATLVLHIDSTTQPTCNKKKVANLADFKVGDKVRGTYVSGASGTLTASTLKLVGGKGKKENRPASAPATT